MLSSGFQVLDTILELALIHEENKNIELRDNNTYYEKYTSQLQTVKKIKEILTESDGYTQYETQSQIKINFILAIASYLDFEITENRNFNNFGDVNMEFPNIFEIDGGGQQSVIA
jgi:hypothetical protein